MSQSNPSGERDIDLALREAIAHGDWGMAREALAQGADPNASIQGDGFDYAPLPAACDAYSQHQTPQALALIQELLKAGAQASMGAPVSGDTPLHRAARAGWAQAVEALLAAGADPGAKNKEGDQPLHCGALRRAGRQISKEAIQALLAAGADVHAKNAVGLTPLHCACACAEFEVAQALLEAGADARAKAIDGRDGEDFARDAVSSHPQKEQKLAWLAALPAPRRAMAKAKKESKAQKEREWEVARWVKDKTCSSHDWLRQDGKPLAKPGGQKQMAINPLSMMEIGAESELGKAIARRVEGGGGPGKTRIEPGMRALALPWRSHRTEGGMWQETDIEERHFAIVAPIRWGEGGHEACVIAAAHIGYDISQKQARSPASLPPVSELGAHWIVLENEKHLEALCARDDRLGAAAREASRRWNGAWLINPARLEREKIEAATPEAPSRGASPSL